MKRFAFASLSVVFDMAQCQRGEKNAQKKHKKLSFMKDWGQDFRNGVSYFLPQMFDNSQKGNVFFGKFQYAAN